MVMVIDKYWDDVERYCIFNEEDEFVGFKDGTPQDFKLEFEKREKAILEWWEEYAEEAAKSEFLKSVWRYCIFDEKGRFVGFRENTPQDFKNLLEEDLKDMQAGAKSWLSEDADEIDLTDIESWLAIIQSAGGR